MKKTEYAASFLHAVQCSPDDWKVKRPTLKVTDETTIGEIRKWMADNHRAANETEFTVTILETR